MGLRVAAKAEIDPVWSTSSHRLIADQRFRRYSGLESIHIPQAQSRLPMQTRNRQTKLFLHVFRVFQKSASHRYIRLCCIVGIACISCISDRVEPSSFLLDVVFHIFHSATSVLYEDYSIVCFQPTLGLLPCILGCSLARQRSAHPFLERCALLARARLQADGHTTPTVKTVGKKLQKQ